MNTTKQKWLYRIYNWGACVIIIGIMAKLTHFKMFGLSGNALLMTGLTAEAIVFFLSGFDTSGIGPSNESGWKWTIRKDKVTKDNN